MLLITMLKKMLDAPLALIERGGSYRNDDYDYVCVRAASMEGDGDDDDGGYDYAPAA
ncbi:hypothetical protein ACHQM5_008665 [Ranunculus cassubicifolius]